jgi:predicted transcriptional regulator
VTVQLLLKLGRAFDVDLAAFAEDDEGRVVAGLREVLADPLFEAADVRNQDLKDVAAASPALAQAFVTLYRAYREAREDLQGLAETMAAGEGGAPAATAVQPGAFPQEEVEAFIQDRGNHFPELELAAEELWIDGDIEAADVGASLARHLERAHGVRTRVLPVEVMGQTIRRFDRHSRRLLLSEAMAPSGRTFHTAAQIGLLRARPAIDALVAQAGLPGETARGLLTLSLANHFAAAVMMPYGRFVEAARTTRYDIEVLQARFGASFEQVCHRLTTLSRPTARGVPFFMIRVDSAGNVSKRFAAGSFPFSKFGGTCPLWNVHSTFKSPGRVFTQVLEMPDGARYFSIARTVRRVTSSFTPDDPEIAVGVGCELKFANRLAQARDLDLAAVKATPIGINCRLCERPACSQRAAPPMAKALIVDETLRGLSPFRFEVI